MAVSLAGVSKHFERARGAPVVALDDINLTVLRHEFVALIGPSGCGKSTILRLLAGLMPATSGSTAIFGYPMEKPRDDIGIVFQRPTLLPWLSIRNNVLFPIRHKRRMVTPALKQEADRLLEVVGLADFAESRPSELSGGMQQRAAIARALVQNPDILLMDEPFSALDALTRDEMALELLRIWAERPKTVVFVTHSIPEALLLSDRIIVMSARPGRIVRQINVPFARPRSLATMEDPAFNNMANDIRRGVFSAEARA
ncbi:ABC transporter ATP-binding protein [Acuticoccus sp. 2012]|uniref:ABC transporter ATP-binding protein n=1 Tax=Acuticoccus mangrovi TaxID=2796142 RepID=A0A934MF04_9HYPH|nr:ABC transporter ATP-binding protein [Acuticoccus mangrovi]